MREGWKQKILSELFEYWIVAAYLACFFGVFTWYQRFILAEQHISYFHYGTAVIQGLVLAKVILIGDALHFAQKLEDKPLIVPTLYKAVAFSVFVGGFAVLERVVEGLLRDQGLAAAVEELVRVNKYEVLARCLVTFCAFIPFFAFKELQRVLRIDNLRTLFFRGRGFTASDLSR